jgi:hypothetical protein
MQENRMPKALECGGKRSYKAPHRDMAWLDDNRGNTPNPVVADHDGV